MPDVRTAPNAVAGFFFIMSLSGILMLLSWYNLYRQYIIGSQSRLQKFSIIRYMTALCCTFQMIMITGYLINELWMQQSMWLVWIPTSFAALLLLGLKLAQSYLDMAKATGRKVSRRVEIACFSLWLAAVIVDAVGSIYGFVKSVIWFQLFCYATWKLFAGVALCTVLRQIYRVRTICMRLIGKKMKWANAAEREESRKSLAGIRHGVKRMLILFISMALFTAFLFGNCIQEFVYMFAELHSTVDEQEDAEYSNTPTWFVGLLYFPVWSWMNVTLLVYSWVPQSRVRIAEKGDVSKMTGDTSRSPRGAPKLMKVISHSLSPRSSPRNAPKSPPSGPNLELPAGSVGAHEFTVTNTEHTHTGSQQKDHLSP